MKFLNHTPHAITVETAVGPLTFAPQPQAVRLEQIDSEMVSISGIGVIQRSYGSGTSFVIEGVRYDADADALVLR